MNVRILKRNIITFLSACVFALALASFSAAFLTYSNTLALLEPVIRKLAPRASVEEIARINILVRKLGHFLIPAAAYLALVLGPLRNRPRTALIVCVMFGVLDETLQAFSPGRTGSVYDVALDASGALFSCFVYAVFSRYRKAARVHSRRSPARG
jgi:VanZ family protein